MWTSSSTPPDSPKPGETLIGSRFEQLFGGKGANQAAAAALLGSPVRVVMRVGRDDLGQATRKNFERLGIDSKHVSDSKDAATGVALITVDSNGENTIVVASGANANSRRRMSQRRSSTAPLLY